MGHKEECCMCPIPFPWFWTPFSAMCLLKLWFFRNCLSQRLKTCGIGFSMPQTLNKCHWSHFNALIPIKINKMWNFDCFLNSPNKKLKNVNLHREKVFAKVCKFDYIGFGVCWLQCTMSELCVTSTFWVIMVSLHFLWEGLNIGFWNMM